MIDARDMLRMMRVGKLLAEIRSAIGETCSRFGPRTDVEPVSRYHG